MHIFQEKFAIKRWSGISSTAISSSSMFASDSYKQPNITSNNMMASIVHYPLMSVNGLGYVFTTVQQRF
jgi:hypothetical protein